MAQGETIYPYMVLGSRKYGDIALNGVFTTDYGMEAVAGTTGLGLPPVATQWREGAGDGSTFRGRRVLSRDLDIPLFIKSKDREDLKARLSHLALVLSDEVEIRFVESEILHWYAVAHRMGGGEYVYGADTQGEDDLMTVLTFRAGDPYWTSSQTSSITVKPPPETDGGLLTGGSLVNLDLMGSQTFGEVILTNTGDADAYPVWTIQGPCDSFEAKRGNQRLRWNGSLGVGESLTIDTRTGQAIDDAGANRYSEMGNAPRMWKIPPGESTATIMLTGTGPTSLVTCTWRPRKWLVV
jgi:phage-related protein